ncbi:MAG: sigma-70 family RNA polymerase sigma factor [Acidimicrobiales bacterium]
MATLPGPAGELWLLVEDLPLRRRTAVVLRHVGQLTEPEIAQVMGISRGTVSATLRQAYAALRMGLAVDEPVRREKEDDDVTSR